MARGWRPRSSSGRSAGNPGTSSSCRRRTSGPFAAGATVLERPPKGGKIEGVLFRPARREDLPRDLRRFRRMIEEHGFLWVAIPKKAAMQALGRDVTFEDVLDVALRTDLVDNRTLTFSDAEYGVRLVIPKDLWR